MCIWINPNFLHLLKFDVLCFSEWKIIAGINTTIDLEGCQEPIGMPTKATEGEVLIYVKNEIGFEIRILLYWNTWHWLS